MKILITDCNTLTQNGDLSLDVFKSFGDVVFCGNLTEDEVLREIADADILLCNKTPVTAEVFAAAKSLKYIGLFATGYNNIDMASAAKNGVTVCNAGSYSTDAVAQQTFAYILSHYSRVRDYDALVKEGKWKNAETFSLLNIPTDELANKTLGIVGYGNIGKRVADIALAFSMNVSVYNRSPRCDDRVNFVSFDELLKTSDIITVHCPLNNENRDMFNADAFSKMRDGAFFINTARGGLVCESDLFDALNSGKLCGAAVDVLKSEPMSADCKLFDAPNIIITPHTAWAPLSTRKRLVNTVANNIKAFLSGNPVNVVR